MARQTPARFIGLGFGFVWIVAVIGSATSPAAADRIDFVKDIQPIFQKSCYRCHGPKLQMGGLRLDAKKPALAGGQSGKAIQPGSASESPLYKRIAGIGEQPRMPMGGEPLAAAEIALIRAWIDQGAEWPDAASGDVTEVKKKHWAFIAPSVLPCPRSGMHTGRSNPIDNFVLARLEKEGLAPSPEADRVTLLRRLSLDLIGLPPTIEEVDAFLTDKSRNAYEKQVETAADLAALRRALGTALARRRPLRRFRRLREGQAAQRLVLSRLGDQRAQSRPALRPVHHRADRRRPAARTPTQDQIVATGFLRNSMINEEGGVDPEQFRMEAMFDRMDAIGKGILGVTIQCAQCHNHKYDPLTQEEYYRLFAFLNNSHEANIAVYTPAEQMKRAEIFRQHSRDRRPICSTASPTGRSAWRGGRTSVAADQPEWIVVRPDCRRHLDRRPEVSAAQPMAPCWPQGYAPTKHRVKMTVKTDLAEHHGLPSGVAERSQSAAGRPGPLDQGNLRADRVRGGSGAGRDTPTKPTKMKIANATADINLPETPLEAIFDDKTERRRVTGPIEFAIDGKDETAWGIDAGPAGAISRARPSSRPKRRSPIRAAPFSPSI